MKIEKAIVEEEIDTDEDVILTQNTKENEQQENEIKINEKLEDCLDKQFPKGDKARGRALVLFAEAQMEIDKARKEGFRTAWEIAQKLGKVGLWKK